MPRAPERVGRGFDLRVRDERAKGNILFNKLGVELFLGGAFLTALGLGVAGGVRRCKPRPPGPTPREAGVEVGRLDGLIFGMRLPFF